jgi:hypothetical protein
MKTIKLKNNMKCEWEHCTEKATVIACGRTKHNCIGVYCDTHADLVTDEGHPEYAVECPNCGCHFGVN